MSRFVQGRRVITSLARFKYPSPYPYPPDRDLEPRRVWPRHPLGWPVPRLVVRETIERLKLLSPEEKVRFGHIFSELMGLAKPPEPPADGEFAVKLVGYDPNLKSQVLFEIACAKSTVKVMKDLYQMGLGPSIEALQNVPSVIKEGITKEEANEIIAKIKAAGGVAVMEPPE